MSDSLSPHGLYRPWNSLGQNTGVGSLSLLQGMFPTQGLNPRFPHCRRILYQMSHKGSPRIQGWVAYPFSSRSSQPRNATGVSCIAGGFFTNWALRQLQESDKEFSTVTAAKLLLLSCCCYVMSVVPNSVRSHRRQPTRLPSLGFSSQQYWSGLPFSSTVHESEKWKWSRSVMSDPSRPHGL